jgi:predicted dehydrogenase
MAIESKDKASIGKRLNYGMVGGGIGAFIGEVHRNAIALNGDCNLAAGVFSSDKDKNIESGTGLGLDKERIYSDYKEMAKREAERKDGIRFVSIVTPNSTHYDIASAFLKKGINVVCEKPLTTTLEDALSLKKLKQENDCLFAVTYTYTGHVMAKEARQIVRRGDIGKIRVVMGEYPQDWLVDTIERQGQKQAAWRTDPKQSGASNCVGDIGSHIENLVSYITGLKIKRLIANLDILGKGRKLDNNAQIILKYDNGASGSYWCSQVAIGYDNALKVRIFGTEGTIEFEQENCNYLKVIKKGNPPQIYSRGCGYMSDKASGFSRIPPGHPEGLHEAFANIYASFTDDMRKKMSGEKVDESNAEYPTLDMGIDGVRFVEKCVESMEKKSTWVDLE